MTISELMTRIHGVNLAHGWNSQVPDDVPSVFGEKLMLVCTELAEAMEEFRNGHPFNEVRWEPDPDMLVKPEGIAIELADALIRILDLCAANVIDIEKAIRTKLAYNECRPYRHGGKKA
jgi:NTP pyrophosphatase (non-canonical NTP hydrolase)